MAPSSSGRRSTDQHLYVRDTVTEETLQLDLPQPGAEREGPDTPADATFDTASVDGSRVFFTDTQRLTPDSRAGEFDSVPEPDLYVAELSGGRSPGSPLSATLRDLTPEGINGESADIQAEKGRSAGVLGASEDGSYVYFVANSALAPGASRGYCSPEENERPPGTSCNLYVSHYSAGEWSTKFIAALSDEDPPDWGEIGEGGALDFTTSRVSPNGRYLAFMSDASLTGYDNEDVTSESPGERLDEEVYLYDASSERLVCASCNPSGARPAGVLDLGFEGELTEEGEGLVADRLGIWSPAYSELADHWLAGSVPGWTPLGQNFANYQSRYLSNSGRLFFNSPDHLVPAATSPEEKVYEYEPSGVGSCHSEGGCVGLISSPTAEHESAFLDASASGNDVFFLTRERLVQQDTDNNFDVYDARVCEPSAPCLPPPSGGSPKCESVEECRNGSGSFSASSFEAPASENTGGSGNVLGFQQSKTAPPPPPKPKTAPLTRAQKLANALKACKKDRKKSKRLACEKQARKLYGPLKKAKRAKKSSARRRRA